MVPQYDFCQHHVRGSLLLLRSYSGDKANKGFFDVFPMFFRDPGSWVIKIQL